MNIKFTLSECCLYQKDERAKPENLTKRNTRSEIREHWIEMYFYFLFHISNGQLVTDTGAALHLPYPVLVWFIYQIRVFDMCRLYARSAAVHCWWVHQHRNQTAEEPFVGAFAKLWKMSINLLMPVRPSAWNSSAPTGRILMKFEYFSTIFGKNSS